MGAEKGSVETKARESHHIKGFVLVWDNEPGRKQARGPDVKQTERKECGGGGCKGGLGWIFLACGVGEGGIFSRGFSRGVYLELGCVEKTEGEQEGCALYTNASLM